MNPDPLTATIALKTERSWPVPVWAWVLLGSAAILIVNAPRIQADVFPPIERQSIENARWTATAICWRRLSFKNYVAPLVNYDVVLDYPVTVDGMTRWRRRFPEITREDGSAVASDRINPTGWSRVTYCASRTPDMDPDRPVRMRLTIFYRGLWGALRRTDADPRRHNPARGVGVVAINRRKPAQSAPLPERVAGLFWRLTTWTGL